MYLLCLSLGNFTFPHCAAQFALEVANPQPYVFVARCMFTTSTGALQLWQQEAVQWTREESLTEIQAVEFVDLPEKKIVEDALDGRNFITRLLRQIKDARVGGFSS
jgi:ER membrane protein complex subunit 1